MIKECLTCGDTTLGGLNYCSICWGNKSRSERMSAAERPQGGVRASSVGSPLDVPCPYVWTFGPMNGKRCGAGVTNHCTEGSFAPSIDIRRVGRFEFHEARYQVWKAQTLIYEGMD